MPNERSGFLTFIFIWYLLNALAGSGQFLLGLIGTALQFIADPLIGVAYLSIDVMSGLYLTLQFIFIANVVKVTTGLKRWTDITHLFGLVFMIMFVVVSIAAPQTMLGAGVDETAMAFVIGFYGLAVIVEIAFWIGIRSHLARLEREGRASFDPGMFNRSNATRV